MTVSDYLYKKGFQFRERKNDSGVQAIMNCPECNDKGSFAIDLETGAYNCKRLNKCGIKGSFTDFQRMNGDEPFFLDDKFVRTNREYATPTVRPERPNEDIYRWFAKRKITDETVRHFKIGLSPDGKDIMFPYHKNTKLVNVKYRNLTEKKFHKEKDCKSTLWNQDNITGETLIITEGEMDCMALKEYGYEGVSLPSGVNDMTWIEHDWEFIDRFKSVFLIMDNDVAGQSIINDLVHRIGRWKCKNVLLPHKDINECLMNDLSKEDFLKHLDQARDFNIQELKNCDYYTDEIVQYKNDYNKLHGTITSNGELTELLKGWRMEEVSIWTGTNGSGKSTFLSQEIIHLLRSGKKCCIGSFEMAPRKYLWWLVKQACQIEDISDFEVSKTLNEFANDLFIIDIQDEIEKDNLFSIMEFGARKYGIQFFVLDSLMKIKMTTESNRLLGEQKNFVSSLTNFVKKHKTHIHLVAHPRKGSNDEQIAGKSDVAGTGDITNLADNVFVLHRFTEDQKKDRQKSGKDPFDSAIIVKKNREHGNLGEIGFYFDKKHKRFITERV